MDSYLDRKADLTRDLVGRLSGGDPDAVARRTGLRAETVRALLAGDGELMSWEVVSACLAAADVDAGDVGKARARWAAAEQALWDERGDDLREAFEQNRQGKPAKVFEAHRSRVPWRRLTARHPVTFEPWAMPTFGPDRRLPDPSTAGDIRDFYTLLAELRGWAGSPRQSEIEKRSWGTLPDATISAMLQKDRWRTVSDRERTRIGYFAAACGLPEVEVARWVEAYERLRHVPPPDDLARARAEGAELRKALAAAEAEAEALRVRLAAAESRRLTEEDPPTPPDAPRGRRWWDPRERRSLTAAAVAALVFAGGVGTGRVAAGGPSPDRPVCFRGTLQLIGSTAFERTADTLGRGYEALCEDADVEVRSIGSVEGVRALTTGDAASTIAMHDGHLRPDSDEIRSQGFLGLPVALVAFAVVVHKDAKVTGLSLQELRSVYAREGGPTNWRRFKGGADLPIRLVGRTEGSGTRTVFEELVLNESEPELSSRDCLRKDEIRAAARIIRCERSSQGQVLDTVDRVPGAIGYAELHVAANARRYPDLRILTLDGRRADAFTAGGRYPFVAPEVFYTHGPPPNGSPAAAFLTFLAGGSARRLIQQAGAPPCLTPDALISAPCQNGRS
ncbi:substrate-binding domain-containing protein [Thermomonospora umbrina]|uniref:ABC-type phosphate transport system substrate-binding protein n=1 Tax=Thermomonospora umbrina TaxID=111806 RepID=A0A3D9T1Z7_9ACTN|nr:substrate-binding domain-containing protein [Thermomonospora umbrina]REE97861.1 ABC-type phosphate transport system substrate-binding protein [Thermomonospora umbrina]